MKYLFINSVMGVGSTGKIAAEQCRKLMAQGHTCAAAYGRQIAHCDDLTTYRIGTDLDFKLHGIKTRLLDAHGFGSAGATKKFLRWAEEFDPDVLWLHNIHGYYLNVELLFKWIKSRPQMQVRWTLHDCWSFTGHCAYFDFAGCDRWKTGCHDCPQKAAYPATKGKDASPGNYRKKQELFTGVPHMTLITPSRWLAELVKESFLKEYPVEVVYNTINTDIFHPTASDFRQKHGLEGKKVILGVANIWEKRKGLEDFLALSRMADDTCSFVLVGRVPEGSPAIPEQILCISRTDSPQELAQIYTAADVLVNPTYEDNYPTVNLEALACGTPVITYRTGGSPESVDDSCGAVVEKSPEARWEAVKHADCAEEACLRRSAALNSGHFGEPDGR